MAIDPEEFKQRRLQRQQQRQNDQRKLVVKLILAVFLLFLAGTLIFVFTRPKKADPTTTEPTTVTQPQSSETAATTEPVTSDTVIHFAVAGDLNITDNVIAAGGEDLDYTNAFLDVAHLLADADISAVNFEGNFCDAPYGSTGSAPVSLAQALSDAGVDLLQLANSYPINFGMSGLATTIDRVRSAGMEPLGVYASREEAKQAKGYTLRNVGGIKIAFVSFTKGMDGLALPAGNEDCVNILYKDYSTTYQELNTEGVSAVLDAVAKEKPDLTVALLHWGSQFNDTISATQEEVRDLFLEKGVDAIIGTHSHFLQKMEYDPEAGTFVAYSLGDFFGDAAHSDSEFSVVLNLEITKSAETGDTKITGYDYTPIFTVAEEEKPLRVMRIKETMSAFENFYIDRVSQETYDAMARALQQIDTRLKGE